MHFKKKGKLLNLVAIMGTIGACSLPVMAQVSTEGINVGQGKSWDQQVLVPYVDVEDTSLFNLQTISQKTGVARYNLGFIVADKQDNPTWLEDRMTKDARQLDKEVARELKSLRDAGMDAMISFGGPQGTALYEVEDSATQLKNDYAKVINAYSLTAADFYMAGTAIDMDEEETFKTNIDALVELKKEKPGLDVWMTFEVDDTGIDGEILDVIAYAIDEQLDFEGINFVVTEYDESYNTYSKATEAILEDAHEDLKMLMPKATDEAIWAQMGVTLILDENAKGQDLEVVDAKEVAAFAADQKMGYVGYYLLGDDTSNYDFTKAFAEELIVHAAVKAPINLDDKFVSFDQVVLGWETAKDSGAVSKYNVYRQEGNQKMTTYIGQTEDKTFVDTKELKADTTYTYYVNAQDAVGNVSEYSEGLKVTTLKDNLKGITISEIKDKDVTDTSITLNWDRVRDADHYLVYRNGEKIAKTEETTYTDKNLNPNTTYSYTIQAIDEKGNVIAISKPIAVTTDKKDGTDKPETSKPGYKGQWKPGATYVNGDVVKYKDTQYVCVQGHQALGDWQPPNVLALWNVVPGNLDGDDGFLDANETTWQIGVSYKVGDVVYHQGKTYSCVQANVAYTEGYSPSSAPALWGLYDID